MLQLRLKILRGQFSIHRFPLDSEIPSELYESSFFTISKTEDEISVVCDSSIRLNSEKTVTGWSCFKVVGPLDFSLTGILAKLSSSLAKAGISIFAISTYNTDYILVSSEKLQLASEALLMSGYIIEE